MDNAHGRNFKCYASVIIPYIVSWESTHSQVSSHALYFYGVNVAASIQMYGFYIPGKRPSGPKSRVMFKHPRALARDTTVYY